MILCPFKDLRRYADVIPGLEEAIQTIEKIENYEPKVYPLSGNNKVIVQAGTTNPLEGAQLEAHRQFLDVQYILEGHEVMGWAPVDTLTIDGEFNTEHDYALYDGPSTPIAVPAGYCYVVYPEDAHAPAKHLDAPVDYKKIVVKLAL